APTLRDEKGLGSVNIPNLSRIIETHVPVTSDYLQQLRRDVLPFIRQLQADGHIRWFSFLLHAAGQLSGRDPADATLVIHLRLEMVGDGDSATFAKLLPAHFLTPTSVQLSDVSGVDGSELRELDWARAWRLVGEASEFVLSLLEEYKEPPSPQRAIQFLHFITNGLGMGGQCLYAPSRITF
ncbi:MAG: hypothetical protein ACRDGM_15040, partial [bacterium]